MPDRTIIVRGVVNRLITSDEWEEYSTRWYLSVEAETVMTSLEELADPGGKKAQLRGHDFHSATLGREQSLDAWFIRQLQQVMHYRRRGGSSLVALKGHVSATAHTISHKPPLDYRQTWRCQPLDNIKL